MRRKPINPPNQGSNRGILLAGRVAIQLAGIFLLSLIIPLSQTPIHVSAASGCDGGDFETPEWNQTVRRQAKVPWSLDYGSQKEWQDSDDIFEDDDDDDDDMEGRDADGDQVWNDDAPEERWMTWDDGETLSLLKNDFQTIIEVSEDAVGSLKFNLDYQRRTTFCITIEDYNETTNPDVDVYLMTSNQYNTYESDYDRSHGAWGEWRQDRELQDIPVEWRSFRILGWNSFRDSHQYENVNQVTFSVSLDSPEVTTSIFGGTEIQHFYLVIDNTNNSHANDALPETTVAAYISVVTEERTTILPPWTVSVTCCGFVLGLIAVPMLLNKRYMNSGVSLVQSGSQIQKEMIPSLEQNQEINTQEESKRL